MGVEEVKLNSGYLEKVSYDETTRRMFIEFKGGNLFAYSVSEAPSTSNS